MKAWNSDKNTRSMNRSIKSSLKCAFGFLFFSISLSSCFYTRVSQCLKLLNKGKEYQTLCKNSLSAPLHSKSKKFKDFSRTPPKIQGLFKSVRALSPVFL